MPSVTDAPGRTVDERRPLKLSCDSVMICETRRSVYLPLPSTAT